MNGKIIDDIVYLFDAWERGDSLENYINERLALYKKLEESIDSIAPDVSLFRKSEREAWRYANELGLEIKRLQELTEKREWVGLTDEEITEAVGSPLDEVYLSDFRKVEAKIKEKNV